MASKPQNNPVGTLSAPTQNPAESDHNPPHMIGYARVSTADQDPQMQIDALLREGVNRLDIYEETASGGGQSKRPIFAAMMGDLRQGDVLVVWKLDRLGRSVRQVLNTFSDLDDRGVKIRVITQPGMDTTTVMGRLIVTIMAAVAEMERDLIRERTTAGLKASRERGRIGGRRESYTDAQIKAAMDLIEGGASVQEARMAVKDRKGSAITAVRLRARIKLMEDADV